MKKAMKKTLFALLVCIILLAGAAFVSSATEVNTEPWVEDLSLATGTHTYAFNPEANNRINYVVTGSNPDAEIYVWGSCNITLRNASFRRLHIDYADSYTVNITLEGENAINQYNWASQGALEIYSSQVTINGGENDSLYASSRAFTVFSNSHDLGCLTVNGGNCTFKSVENGNPFQTQYIQNGGNVTVIEEYGPSFLYDVQLNGGTLEILNNKTTTGIVFSQYLRIKKGADLKISIPNTPYIAYDNIKLAESSDANDCIFVRFDESSDYIYLNDDNRELNGKNYMEIKVVEHIHACENGVCSCGFVCEHNTDGGTCGICGKYIYKIAHQPTAAEPYVSLNDGTGASYQWYEVKGISEITDKSKTYPWSYFWAPFEEESTYSEAEGWTPIVYSEEGYESEYAYLYYFVTRYSEGDKVTLSFSSPVIYADLFTIDGVYAECEIDGTTATAVIPENGVYGICAETENTAPTVKVYTGDAQYTAITGEAVATLKKYSYGNYYFCQARANDGTVLKSSLADFSYKITHQPTDREQYVSLNSSDGASYQWYFEKDGRVSVTDENSYPFTVFDAPPEIGGVCDSENGWTPDEYGYYFVVKLKEGDILNLEFSQTPEEVLYLYSSEEGTVEDEADITAAGSIIAESDGYYAICAADGGTLKATMNGPEYIAVNGQTEATLNADKLGNYLCEVTFKDGKKERSEAVSVQHLHTGGTATCRERAECSACGMQYGSLNMNNHTALTVIPAEAANCSKAGKTAGERCTDCGTVTVVQTTVPATGNHTGGTATCKSKAVCTVCGNAYGSLNANNHKNITTLKAVAATCSKTGKTEGKKCTDCGTVTVAQTTVPATGNHTGGTATCKSKAVCTVCGNAYGSFNMNNHTALTVIPAEAATCSKAGKTAGERCTDCGTVTVAQTTVPTTGNHTGGTATCKSKAVCTVCEKEYGSLNANSHKNITTLKAVAATCTRTGKTEGKKCSDCGKVTVAQNTVPAKGHKLTTLKAVAATCTKTGKTEGKKCSVCGTVTVAQKTVAKKAHSYKNVTTKATLSKNGKVENKCSVCGYVSKTTTVYYPKTIKLSTTSYTYNGKAKKPTVTVKDSKGNTLKKDTDYTVKYASGRKNPGKYTVTVTFKGKYEGTKKLTFTIKPAKAALSKVTAGSKQATVAWKTVTGATGYEVQYSTSSKLRSAKTATVKKGSTKKTTIKKLTKGKKYYFRVRAYKTIDGKKVYGAWSSVKSVKIK